MNPFIEGRVKVNVVVPLDAGWAKRFGYNPEQQYVMMTTRIGTAGDGPGSVLYLPLSYADDAKIAVPTRFESDSSTVDITLRPTEVVEPASGGGPEFEMPKPNRLEALENDVTLVHLTDLSFKRYGDPWGYGDQWGEAHFKGMGTFPGERSDFTMRLKRGSIDPSAKKIGGYDLEKIASLLTWGQIFKIERITYNHSAF